MNDSHRTEESAARREAKARRIVKGERAVIIAPLKRPLHPVERCVELTPWLWGVSLDGMTVDVFAHDEAHAEQIAKTALADPTLPMWLARRPNETDTP